MTLDLSVLDSVSRVLIEAQLEVATGGGGRFQPTGFPDLGPALYKGADGNQWLLIESPQSMANRMERVCWVDGDSVTDRVGTYNSDCRGIPFVLAVDTDNRPLTASTLEAHRLASPYIWDTQPFANPDDPSATITFPNFLKGKFTISENRLVPWKQLALGLLEVDPACLLHGVWFNDADFSGGKVRITRALSGYIEASDPSPANFGFQKRDLVYDRTEKESGQTAESGYGSVIGPRQHFTSPQVKAYFQIDLERLRSYGLANEQVRALAAWAIYKVRRVLVASRDGIADLRTECKFRVADEADELEGQKDKVRIPKVDAWLVHNETGRRQPYALPEIGEELKDEFAGLKRDLKPGARAAWEVRWVPKIEGKAELNEGITEGAINRSGLEEKSRFDTTLPSKKAKDKDKKPKRLFVIFGEWNESDKKALREKNPADPAKKIVDKAIKSYEAQWQAKAQSTKPESDENDQNGG